MEFTLYYRGDLKSNRGIEDKQKLRRHFHIQLKKLWQQFPLKDHRELFEGERKEGDVNIVHKIDDFKFVPLMSESLHLIAELEITLLRPEPPGSIIIQAGDIDNRLKTLLDALRIPKEPNEIPRGDKPGQEELPFFCLLEDDNLITKISVNTDRLLDEFQSKTEVVLLIKVCAKATSTILANLGLG